MQLHSAVDKGKHMCQSYHRLQQCCGSSPMGKSCKSAVGSGVFTLINASALPATERVVPRAQKQASAPEKAEVASVANLSISITNCSSLCRPCSYFKNPAVKDSASPTGSTGSLSPQVGTQPQTCLCCVKAERNKAMQPGEYGYMA